MGFPVLFVTPFDVAVGALSLDPVEPKMALELKLRPLAGSDTRLVDEVVDEGRNEEVEELELVVALDTRRGRELMDARVSRRYRGLELLVGSSGMKSSSSLTVEGDVDASSSKTSVLLGAENE